MEFGGLSESAVMHSMDVTEGSTITGFYGYGVSTCTL